MPWQELPDADKSVVDAFRRKARILVDESLGSGVALFLREQGCNVVFAGDANGEMTIRSRDATGQTTARRYRLTIKGAEQWHEE